MVGIRKKGLLAALAVLAALLVASLAGQAFAASPWGEGVGRQVQYKHNGGHDYEISYDGNDWHRVYCLDPAKGYSDAAQKNMNTRWEATLDETNFNWYIKDVNAGHRPSWGHINRLVSILWKADQLGANVDDTQNAVWWFSTQGADDDIANNVSQYNNYIVRAAADSGWATPETYTLYFYAADSTASGGISFVQSMTRLVYEDNSEPPTPPTPPEWNVSTTVVIAGDKASNATTPATIILEAGETEIKDLAILDKIQYSKMQNEAGHVFYTKAELWQVDGDTDEDGNKVDKFIRARSLGQGPDVDGMPEGEPYWIRNADYKVAGDPSQGTNSTSANATIVDDSGSGEWAFSNSTGMWQTLGAGTYYINLSLYDFDTGMTMSFSGKGDNRETFIIKPAETEDTGNLVIKKTFAGNLLAADQSKLSITITGKDIGGEGVNTKTVTYADFTNGEYKVTGMPVGETYTVKETNAENLNASYKLVAASSTTEGTSDKIAANADVTVELTNTYEQDDSGDNPRIQTTATGTVKPEANQTITDTITWYNLPAGKYTAAGTLRDADGKEIPSEGGSADFEVTEAQAEEGQGTVEVTFTFDASSLKAGDKIVVFEKLLVDGKPYTYTETDNEGNETETAVVHEDLTDVSQTVTVTTEPDNPKDDEPTPSGGDDEPTPSGGDDTPQPEPGDDQPTPTPTPTPEKNPSLKTTVKVNGTAAESGKALVVEGAMYQAIKLVDTIDYADLNGGETYTVSGKVMKFPGGTEVKTATETKVADASGSGTWELDFGVVPIERDSYYVVFEYASDASGAQVASHEDANDIAQAVLVTEVSEDWPIIVENPGVVNNPVPVSGLTMATTVSINDKAASSTQARTVSYADVSKVKNVKDIIAYSGFEAGATYTIRGELIDVATGKAIATAEKQVEASGTGEGTWTVDFTGVSLEAGKKYVVFEYAYDADGNLVAEHKDINDLAQTIVVTAKPVVATPATTTSGARTTAKTVDDMGGTALTMFALAVLAAGGVVVARRKGTE